MHKIDTFRTAALGPGVLYMVIDQPWRTMLVINSCSLLPARPAVAQVVQSIASTAASASRRRFPVDDKIVRARCEKASVGSVVPYVDQLV